MTRTETIAFIEQQLRLPEISDQRLLTVAELVKVWTLPTVYDTLPDAHKSKILHTVERIKSGHTVPADNVFKAISLRLRSAGL